MAERSTTTTRAGEGSATSKGSATSPASASAPADPGSGVRLLAAHLESPVLSIDARLATGGVVLRVGPARVAVPRPALLAAAAGMAAAAVAEAPLVLAGAAAAALAYRKRLRRLVPTVSLFDTTAGPEGVQPGGGGR